MARARILDGIDPNAPETSYVVVSVPEGDSSIARVLDGASEGDGAFYLSTDSVWVERRLRTGRLEILVHQRRGEQTAVVLHTQCDPGPGQPAASTLIVQSSADWSDIREQLIRGDLWPVILGPRSSPSRDQTQT